MWFYKVCYFIFVILYFPDAFLVPSYNQKCLCGDSNIHGGWFPCPGNFFGPGTQSTGTWVPEPTAFAGCLSLDLCISNPQRQNTLWGNANQSIVPTEVRSCTELPFCPVKQHSTSISLLGWQDLHKLVTPTKADATHPVAALGLLPISAVHIHSRSLREYRQCYHFSWNQPSPKQVSWLVA